MLTTRKYAIENLVRWLLPAYYLEFTDNLPKVSELAEADRINQYSYDSINEANMIYLRLRAKGITDTTNYIYQTR